MDAVFIFLGLVLVFCVSLGCWAIMQKPKDTKAA